METQVFDVRNYVIQNKDYAVVLYARNEADDYVEVGIQFLFGNVSTVTLWQFDIGEDLFIELLNLI